LDGVATGSSHDVAVGDGGTILERQVGDSETGAGGGNSTDTSGGNSTDTGNETNSTAIETAIRSMDAPTAEPLSVENYIEGEWVTPPER
ncbi:hypothetical protein ACFQE6_12550, partial [Natrinema soli]